jgi:REP element-mobilizing transposase RayT
MARVVATGLPHPVTQRGNRRQQTFFAAADYAEYRQLMAASCAGCGTEVWVYCLMPNHVHRVAVPANPDGLRCAIAEAHRRYTKSLSARQGWRGHPQAGALPLLRHGREPSLGGGTHCGKQPGSGGVLHQHRSLALVKRLRAGIRPQRRVGNGRSDARAGGRLAELPTTARSARPCQPLSAPTSRPGAPWALRALPGNWKCVSTGCFGARGPDPSRNNPTRIRLISFRARI